MIVDAHFHYGTCRVFDLNVTREILESTLDDNDIAVSVVQPYPGAPDPVQVHDDIAALNRETDGRVVGLASLNPHRDPAEYFAEVERCVRQLGFVGVKLHTIGHAVNPGGADGGTVFETARDLDIPVMIHTGPGVPFADPAGVMGRARQFPEVTVILAHAGAGIFSGGAMAVADACDNVVLETSWCRPPDMARMVEKLGAHRVMLGTDSPSNTATELTKFHSIGLNSSDLDAVLGGTAKEVFRLP